MGIKSGQRKFLRCCIITFIISNGKFTNKCILRACRLHPLVPKTIFVPSVCLCCPKLYMYGILTLNHMEFKLLYEM